MTLSSILYYLSWIVWILLLIALVYGTIRRKWDFVKRTIKYLINSSVFLIGWSFYLELALIVRSPILITNEASVQSLKDWIWNYLYKDILISIVAIILLLGINLLFHYKVENRKYKSDPVLLAASAILILAFSILNTGEDTFFAFMQERNRH